MVFPRKRTSGSGTSSRCNSRILTSASNAMLGFCGLPVPSFFMTSGTRHVLDGYEPPRARAFDRGQVYPQLLRSTPGGVCGLRLLCSVSLSDLIGLIGDLSGNLLSLLGCLPCGVLGLTGYLSCLVGGLPCSLLGLACCLSCGVLGLTGSLSSHVLRSLPGLASGPILAGPVFHLLGCLYHVADYDASVAARTLDLGEVYAPLLCFAASRVRGLDLALAPDLVRVQVGDVLLRLADALLHRRVVVHQLLKKCLKGFLSSPRDLVRQALKRGTVVSYVLFEHVGRITEVLLGQVHRPLLDLAPGLLDALI